MRKSIVGMVGVAVALMLSACGSVGGVASSIIAPCRGDGYYQVLWSPDGQSVAFAASIRDKSGPRLSGTHIYVMDPDGTGIKQLSPYLDPVTADLQWLPDSRGVFFSNRMGSFVEPEPDINNYILTTNDVLSEIDLYYYRITDVLFSPDGQKIAFNRMSPNGQEIAEIEVANKDGSGNIELTAGPGQFDVEAWSPDSTRIAYLRINGGRTYVSMMRADGSDQHQIIEGRGPVRWSPDGQWLSYMSGSANSALNLHVVKLDGTGAKLVVADSSVGYLWLPDSQHIAFISNTTRYLTVVNINTLTIETISNVQLPATTPSASPDGKQIAFIGLLPTSSPYISVQDIYIVNRDGTGQTRLTDNPGRYQCFNWPF